MEGRVGCFGGGNGLVVTGLAGYHLLGRDCLFNGCYIALDWAELGRS